LPPPVAGFTARTDKMTVFVMVMRRIWPKLYIKLKRAQIDRNVRELKTRRYQFTSSVDYQNTYSRLIYDRTEFDEWEQEIEDAELAKKALKLGIYLDEIDFRPIPDNMQVDRSYGPYRYIGTFGNTLFRDDFRRPLSKAVRAQELVYRKEQRERMEIMIKLIAALTGVLGTAIGVLAFVKK
jgi:hypothetical protein